MKTWEYLSEEIGTELKALERRGAEGWELVQLITIMKQTLAGPVGGFIAVFKREAPPLLTGV